MTLCPKPSVRFFLISGVLATFVAACVGSTSFGGLFTRGSSNTPEETEILTSGEVRDNWLQPNENENLRPLTFIVVEDTSGSLDNERPRVVTALENFLATLDTYGIADYCLGVMFGHVGNKSGKLVSNSGDKCLCSSEYSDAELLQKFSANFTNADDEGATDGGEAGLYSFYQLVKGLNDGSYNPATEGVSECFRENAAIVAAFMADENDISTSPDQASGVGGCSEDWEFSPQGPASAVDGECGEMSARANYYSTYNEGTGKYDLFMDHSFVLAEAVKYQGVLPFRGASVTYQEGFPTNGENETGYGYIEFAEESGGFLVDLKLATDGNQSGFNDAWTGLAEDLALSIQLLTTFDLSHTPCGEELISVKVDGVTVPFNLVGSKRVTIDPSDAGTFGSEVQIQYEICE